MNIYFIILFARGLHFGQKILEKSVLSLLSQYPGAQIEGDLAEILVLGAKISPYIGLREKWESLLKKKKFTSCQHTIDTLSCQFNVNCIFFV